MRIYVLRRKSTQEALFPIIPGQSYRCPAGEDPDNFEVVGILIPEQPLDFVTLEDSENEKRLDSWASHFGIALSDLIETAAKAFGVPPCSVCALRKQILYALGRLGWLCGFRLIFKTLRGKALSDKERILVQGLWPT
jgi:hypothetical protein